jgi:pimeloyl-ACP methyl ester carboxylesterase
LGAKVETIVKRTLSILVLAIAGLIGLMALFPEEATQWALFAERSRSGLSYKTVVVDGEIWHYLEGGPAEAEVLLLLHGFGADKDNWTRFSNSLTDNYRVIAPDLPGFGESARHQGQDYSLIPQRDRLNSFTETLGLGRFHITGNSMGGQLAAMYTHEYPDQILSLALFNNAGIVAPDESDLVRALKSGRNPLVVDTVEDFDRLIDLAAILICCHRNKADARSLVALP